MPDLLAQAARERGGDAYLEFNGQQMTIQDLHRDVVRTTASLRRLGVRPHARVALMLANHPRHVVLMLAVIALGAVWVPINPKQRGDTLRHQLTVAAPNLILVEAALDPGVSRVIDEVGVPRLVWEQDGPSALRTDHVSPTWEGGTGSRLASDTIGLMFTSGTSGPPKAVQVTDSMLRASSLGAVLAGDGRDGDVFLMWEPLCHIGGAQVLLLPLVRRITVALLDRFSASAFWQEATRCRATHIHHLGGILSMLLAQPEHDRERQHGVRISWGGGVTAQAWREAEARFGLSVRECYGMTEASSISTVNDEGPDAGVGRPVPFFDVEIHDPSGRPVAGGSVGEIALRPRQTGLVTPGYLDDEEATGRAWRDGFWYTGDAGRLRDGRVHFEGRMNDSVRHHGENVSAWEVETVANRHPAVSESALVGVPNSAGEHDLVLFVTSSTPDASNATDVVAWCRQRLAAYQVPRYVAFVDHFAKTPSQRNIKAGLVDRDVRWHEPAPPG